MPEDAALGRFYMTLDIFLEARTSIRFGKDFVDYASASARRKAVRKQRRKEEGQLHYVRPEFSSSLGDDWEVPDSDSIVASPIAPESLVAYGSAAQKPKAALAPEVRACIERNRAAARQPKLPSCRRVLPITHQFPCFRSHHLGSTPLAHWPGRLLLLSHRSLAGVQLSAPDSDCAKHAMLGAPQCDSYWH